MANIITRRSFMKASVQAALAAGLASVLNIPPFLRRALAEGTIGISGKKLLFIFLRGGNDGMNNVIPVQDPGYLAFRPTIGIPPDPTVNYGMATGTADVQPATYPYAIRLGNGFAGLHPRMGDMVSLFNAGDLALVHRVGYRSQSRSHFDSERYWEKGADGTAANRQINDGIFYRTIVESGWNLNHALSGVSIQSNMPQSLRGKQPMTNLSSLNRYNLLGVVSPSGTTNTDRLKLLNAIDAANLQPHPTKNNRDLVYGLGTAFRDTLDIFQDPIFATNDFRDTDGTYLFPINDTFDVEDPTDATRKKFAGMTGFFSNLKSAAQILANTDAIIAGTEFGGFDSHTNQIKASVGPHSGDHANRVRAIAWAYYALWKFFSNPAYNTHGRDLWNDVVVVTLSEFGRTSVENDSVGTDHAEANVTYVAGGSVNGGVYGCDANTNPVINLPNWAPCSKVMNVVQKDGSMFGANTSVGYLRRSIDYRSLLGEIIRDHLGATPGQLNRIIPAYALSSEHLENGGPVGSTPIIGELGLVG